MDSGAPTGLLATPLFGNRATRRPEEAALPNALPPLVPRVTPIRFLTHKHFELNSDNNYVHEFAFEAPAAMHNHAPWSVCVSSVHVSQYSCDVAGAELYVQLDAPGAGCCHVVDENIDVDYPLPVGPFNNALAAHIWRVVEPTQFPLNTNESQQIIGRWGGYASAVDAVDELEFGADGRVAKAPPSSPIVYYARKNSIKLENLKRDGVVALCKELDDKTLRPLRKNLLTCGANSVRLMMPRPPPETALPIGGVILFECKGQRIDMVRQRAAS